MAKKCNPKSKHKTNKTGLIERSSTWTELAPNWVWYEGVSMYVVPDVNKKCKRKSKSKTKKKY